MRPDSHTQNASAEDIALGMMIMSERRAEAQRSMQSHGAAAASAMRRITTNLAPVTVETNAPFVADLRLMGALP
jgi:hypothetical protein